MGTRTSVDAAETRGVEWPGERPVGQLAFVADGPSWRPGSAERAVAKPLRTQSGDFVPGSVAPRATDWKIDDSGFVCSGRYGCEEASRHAQPCLANARRAPSVAFAQPPRALEPFRRTPTPLPLARTMFAVAARHPTSVSVGRPFAPLAARARVASAAPPPCRARARAPRARCHHPRGGYHREGHQGRARGDDEGARPDPTLRTTPPPSACQHLP